MIQAKVYARRGRFVLEINGHASRERDGPSIPCASVSTVAQVVVSGLQAVQMQYPEDIALDIDYEDSDEVN